MMTVDVEVPRLPAPEDPTAVPPPTVAVDFLTALRSGRPIRRRTWITMGPLAAKDEGLAILAQHWWIYPRVLFPSTTLPNGQKVHAEEGKSIFVCLANGQIMTLTLDDHLASDWEVMP